LIDQFVDTGKDLEVLRSDGERGDGVWSIWRMTLDEAQTVQLGPNGSSSTTSIGNYGVAANPIPEPTMAVLLGFGGIMVLRRWR